GDSPRRPPRRPAGRRWAPRPGHAPAAGALRGVRRPCAGARCRGREKLLARSGTRGGGGMTLREQLFAVKTVDVLLAEMAGEHRLRRVLGAVIFVLTGLAANRHAGPGLVLSFVIAGAGCALAALCYAEFASMVPVAGSAYAYAYAT